MALIDSTALSRLKDKTNDYRIEFTEGYLGISATLDELLQE